MKKIIKMTIFSILLVLMSGLTLIIIPIRTFKEFTPKTSVVHGPISITGNAQLDAFCAGNGTDGLSWGTAHVIEDLEIEISGAWVHGIEIINTNRFLIIRNCSILTSGGMVEDSGIKLSSCNNIRIENSTIHGIEGVSNAYVGTFFVDSDDVAVVNCIIKRIFTGIGLRECLRVNISHNKIHDNSRDGIYQIDSDWSIINNNTLTNNDRYGINLDIDSDNNHVFYNCIKNNELGDINDDGSNNNIHDNDVCPLDDGELDRGAIPGFPLIFVFAFVSTAVATIACRTLKNRRRNL
jgi:parallel beta-helix repeat protein